MRRSQCSAAFSGWGASVKVRTRPCFFECTKPHAEVMREGWQRHLERLSEFAHGFLSVGLASGLTVSWGVTGEAEKRDSPPPSSAVEGPSAASLEIDAPTNCECNPLSDRENSFFYPKLFQYSIRACNRVYSCSHKSTDSAMAR